MNTCIYSCLIFLTNALLAFKYGYNLLGLLFLLVTISSVYHHSNYTTLSFIIDQIFVISITLYGFYEFNNKCLECAYDEKILSKLIIVSCILTNFVFYFYGKSCDKYCFDKKYGYYYHSLLHCLASLSYHAVIIM